MSKHEMDYNLYEKVRIEILSAPDNDTEPDLSDLSGDDLHRAITSVALERDRRREAAKWDQHVIEVLHAEMMRRNPADDIAWLDMPLDDQKEL